jgi:hypothetical protein
MEHKQGENTIIYLQANKPHTTRTLIQDREEPKLNIMVKDTSTHNYYIHPTFLILKELKRGLWNHPVYISLTTVECNVAWYLEVGTVEPKEMVLA